MLAVWNPLSRAPWNEDTSVNRTLVTSNTHCLYKRRHFTIQSHDTFFCLRVKEAHLCVSVCLENSAVGGRLAYIDCVCSIFLTVYIHVHDNMCSACTIRSRDYINYLHVHHHISRDVNFQV